MPCIVHCRISAVLLLPVRCYTALLVAAMGAWRWCPTKPLLFGHFSSFFFHFFALPQEKLTTGVMRSVPCGVCGMSPAT
jgi:hypothetical protein